MRRFLWLLWKLSGLELLVAVSLQMAILLVGIWMVVMTTRAWYYGVGIIVLALVLGRLINTQVKRRLRKWSEGG